MTIPRQPRAASSDDHGSRPPTLLGYRYRAAVDDRGGITLWPTAGGQVVDQATAAGPGAPELARPGIEMAPAVTARWRDRLEAALAAIGEDTDELPALFPIRGRQTLTCTDDAGANDITVSLDLVEAADLRRLLDDTARERAATPRPRPAVLGVDADHDSDLDGYRPLVLDSAAADLVTGADARGWA